MHTRTSKGGIEWDDQREARVRTRNVPHTLAVTRTNRALMLRPAGEEASHSCDLHVSVAPLRNFVGECIVNAS